MVDTQSMTRQKGNNGPQRQGSFSGNNNNMNAGNSYNNNNNANNMNQYNSGPLPPPPPPNNYGTYSDNDSNYPMNNNIGSGSVKRKKIKFERISYK